MLYNLKTGKTISITFEQWLNMTEEDEELLVAKDAGFYSNSVFSESSFEEDKIIDEEVLQKEIHEIDELTMEEKYQDIDLDQDLIKE